MKRRILAVGAAVLAAIGPMPGRGAIQTGPGTTGPVVLIGIDGEDGGPGGHGPMENYVRVVDSMLSGDPSGVLPGIGPVGGNGLLIIGGGKGQFDDVTSMWRNVAANADQEAADGQAGEPISFVNGTSNIQGQSFSAFEIVVVASSDYQTPDGGLTDQENQALIDRSSDVAAHVNSGRGLLGLSQVGLSDRWAYLGDLSEVFAAEVDYDDIDPTPQGRSLGIDDNLDVCCWHEIFTTYPEFLQPLAYQAGTSDVAALGGTAVSVPGEDCDDLADNDGDGLIDGADPECRGANGIYLAMGDSFASGSGNAPYDPATDVNVRVGDATFVNRCRRSAIAYPRVYRDANPGFSIRHAACDGATLQNIRRESQFQDQPWEIIEQPQASQTPAKPTLTTLMIGYDEMKLNQYALDCATAFVNLTCTDHDVTGPLSKFEDDLKLNLQRMRSAWSETQIVVLTYPQVFSSAQSGPCHNISSGSAAWLRQRVSDLNAAIERATFAVGGSRLHLLDIETLFAGRELCSSDPWVVPLKALSTESFHPNAAGHAAIRDRLGNLVEGLPLPPAEAITLPRIHAGLGDSYSSGEGNEEFDPGTDVAFGNDCHRSNVAYPRLMTNPLIHRACSGALIRHLDQSEQEPGEIKQTFWTSDRTDLLTLTIGGNDAKFASLLFECISAFGTCTDGDETFSRGLEDVRAQLPTALDRLHAVAPNARILLLGYPNIFPPVDGPNAVDANSCDDLDGRGALGRIDEDEVRWLRGKAVELNDTIREIAETKSFIEFIPVMDAFVGHELCRNDPWANGAQSYPVTDYHNWFHPKAAGHEQLASIVERYI